MAKWSLLRAGNAANNIAGGGSISPPGPNSVPNAQSVSCTGFMNPVSGAITLTVSVTPPSPAGSFLGVHLFLEIPDQSANPAQVVGTSAVGGSAAVTGPWNTMDLGEYTYSAGQQPWTLTSPGSPNIDATLNYQCRLYAVSFSASAENALVQANRSGASPNVAFTLASLASGSKTAGTSVTATSGPIAAAALAPDNSTGKLKTPVAVIVSSVPANIANWCYQLVLTMGNTDPTQAANRFAVTGLQTQAGLVVAPADGILTPHSFVLDTPTAATNATVWLQSGLMVNGVFQANPIVPGITPSFPISYGSTSGVLDFSQASVSTLGSTVAVENGLFGVAVIGQANIAAASIGTAQIQNAAVTDAQIANVSAAKISTGTLTVGGSSYPSISIFNSSGVEVGWIGQNAATQGAWFQTLAVGGSSPSSAPMTTDSSGNLSITWPQQTGGYGGGNTVGLSLSGGALVATKYSGGNPVQSTYVDGTGINIAAGAEVATMTATSLYVPISITAAQVQASTLVLKAGNLSSNNTGVPMNYSNGGNQGIQFTGTVGGSGGTFGTYSKGIYLYDINGSYIGMIPVI